jgi:hypothetical protein
MEHDYALHFEERSCIVYDKGKEKLIVVEVKMAPNRSFLLTFKYTKDVVYLINHGCGIKDWAI